MKLARLIFLSVLALSVMTMGFSCGKKPKIEPEVIDTSTTIEPTKPAVVDTTPPPKPKETLKESQFKTVYFDFDKFNLRSDAKAALDANFDLLKKFPDVIVKIEGHCDERGTVEYNLSLGEKRAKAAQDYLVGLGIKPNRISIISYGKERPVDPRHNEEAWAKNRRDEFRIISQ